MQAALRQHTPACARLGRCQLQPHDELHGQPTATVEGPVQTTGHAFTVTGSVRSRASP